MDKQTLLKLASHFVETSEDNYVKQENAILDNLVGMKIFEAPLMGFGDAGDKYFARFKDPAVIGSHFMLPKDWLPGAKTVVSFFLPYTETIRQSNRQQLGGPSVEWLHGRYEGQKTLNKLTGLLQSKLIEAGYQTIAPSQDKRIWYKARPDQGEKLSFTTNWSERHVAFVCGLGTFGLSKGLITVKGMAGRFGSLVTELHLDPGRRDYKDVEEYCTICGTCIEQCPADAISFQGKDDNRCYDFLDAVKKKYAPRSGCGKCQVGVPCESSLP